MTAPKLDSLMDKLYKVKEYCNNRTFKQCCELHDCPYADEFHCIFNTMGMDFPYEWELRKEEDHGNES